jgi:hypothetical protein
MSHQNSEDSNNSNNHMLNKLTHAIAEESIGPYDVLCGRHKLAFNNVGNRRMRVTISLALHRYLAQKDRQGKSMIIKSVVNEINNNGGRFLKWSKEGMCFVEINDKTAHQKCSHAFRDMVTARGLGSGSSDDNNTACAAAKSDKTTCTSIFRNHVRECEYNRVAQQQGPDAQSNAAPAAQQLDLPPAAAGKIDTFVNIFDAAHSLLEAADSLLVAPMETPTRQDPQEIFCQKRCASSHGPNADDLSSSNSSSSSSSDSSTDIWFEFERSIQGDNADLSEQDAEEERILFNRLFEQEIKDEPEVKDDDDDDDYTPLGVNGNDVALLLSKKSSLDP